MDTRPCDNCGKYTVFALCDVCKRAEAESKPDATPPPANVHDRHHGPGPAVAAVGDVRPHSETEAAACVTGYNRALADSLKSAEKILNKLAEEHWPLVALVAHLKESFAEDSTRLEWLFCGDDLLRESGAVSGIGASGVGVGGEGS